MSLIQSINGTEISVFLFPITVLTSAVANGLILAFFSQDTSRLLVYQGVENRRKSSYAKGILKVLYYKHQLLITLLLVNVIANEALPVIFSYLFADYWYLTLALSVTFILSVTEIIPMSISSRFGFYIAGFFSYPVLLLVFLFFPITWPVGIILDYLLGVPESLYNKEELKSFISLHSGHTDFLRQDIDCLTFSLDFSKRQIIEFIPPEDEEGGGGGGGEKSFLSNTPVLTVLIELRDSECDTCSIVNEHGLVLGRTNMSYICSQFSPHIRSHLDF